MAVKDGKTRLAISLDDELIGQIEEYCVGNGITKSEFFSELSLNFLAGSGHLPRALLDSFVRSAMSAEIRAEVRKLEKAQRLLDEVSRSMGVIRLA